MTTHHNNATIQREFALSMCGKELGRGSNRTVFVHAMDEGLVIKFEDCSTRFQNVLEWQTWETVKGTHAEKWFAPCIWISHSGSVLIMRRTTQPTKYPKKLPAFLVDTKRTNYGLLGSRFVCHDYGTNMMMDTGLTKRLRNVSWWDDN